MQFLMNQKTILFLSLFFLAACHPQTGAKTSQSATVPVKATAPTASLSPVFFNVDQDSIKDEKVIDQNARWLNANRDKVVVLEGHCDERGDRQYNIWLGDRRARNVMQALMSRGVSENQLIIVSYGKDRPLVRGPGAMDQNRRVEFVAR